MTEQEILSRMRAYVSSHSAGASSQALPDLHLSFEASTEDRGPSLQELRAAQAMVGSLNPRTPGIANQVIQAFKGLLHRSLSWYTRSFERLHVAVVRSLEAHGRAIESLILAHHAAEAQIKASGATARAIALDVSRLEQEFGKRIDHLSEELRVIKSEIQHADPPPGFDLNYAAIQSGQPELRQTYKRAATVVYWSPSRTGRCS